MEKVFVYKTLKKRKTDTKALGHPLYKSEFLQKATLPGYQDVNRGKGYHTIIKDPNSEVKGKVMHVTHADLKKLDDWEDKYRRIKVTLKNGDKVWAYQLKVHKIIEAYTGLSNAAIKLFIDDMRNPAEYGLHNVVWVKNYNDAIKHIKSKNVVWVSFDNDLGGGKTGYDIAKFIEEQVYTGNMDCPEWQIHSSNPTGRKNIEQAMLQAQKWTNKQK